MPKMASQVTATPEYARSQSMTALVSQVLSYHLRRHEIGARGREQEAENCSEGEERSASGSVCANARVLAYRG